MTRMRGAHVTVRSHALLPQPRSRKARRSGLVRDPYRSRLGVGAQRLQVKILARARKKRPPKTAPSGPRLAGNAVERVGPMTARGTRYRSSNPPSPRPQHSLTQDLSTVAEAGAYSPSTYAHEGTPTGGDCWRCISWQVGGSNLGRPQCRSEARRSGAVEPGVWT